MPSFDVVSEVDMQEVKNALDQATREIVNRFDFKGTDSSIDLSDTEITLHSNTEQKLKALVQVLEEKFVRRNVPLKALSYGKVQEASKGAARQVVTLNVGSRTRRPGRSTSSSRPRGRRASRARSRGISSG